MLNRSLNNTTSAAAAQFNSLDNDDEDFKMPTPSVTFNFGSLLSQKLSSNRQATFGDGPPLIPRMGITGNFGEQKRSRNRNTRFFSVDV